MAELRRKLDYIDRAIAFWMHRHGHRIERLLLGVLFLWFGSLKIFGHKSATSVIAKVIYAGDPAYMVPILGWWEIAIGFCLVIRPLVRVSLLLMALRICGTVLALLFEHDAAWVAGEFLVPTIHGQYLIKDAFLFGAALVIGGTVREERRLGMHH